MIISTINNKNIFLATLKQMTWYYHGIFQDECQTCNIDQINETLKFNVNYLINCNVLA